MDERMVMAAALFVCGGALAIGAALAFAQGGRFRRRAKQADAVIADRRPTGPHGQAAVYVRFTDDGGRPVHARAQRRGTRGLRVGDRVTVAYTRGEALGQEMWNIFVLRNGASGPHLRYTGAGAVLAAAAAVLLAAGAAILRG